MQISHDPITQDIGLILTKKEAEYLLSTIKIIQTQNDGTPHMRFFRSLKDTLNDMGIYSRFSTAFPMERRWRVLQMGMINYPHER